MPTKNPAPTAESAPRPRATKTKTTEQPLNAPLLAPTISAPPQSAAAPQIHPTTASLATGATAVWNGTEWVQAPLFGGLAPGYAPQVAAPAAEVIPESFILQNNLPSPHMITDMETPLTFGSHEVIDLTWYSQAQLKNSMGLRKSIKLGILSQITEEERDRILDREADAARAEAMRPKNRKRRRGVRGEDGNIYDADAVDLNRGESRSREDMRVTTSGHPNDPVTMAMEVAKAKAAAAAAGVPFDVATYTKNVTAAGKFLRGDQAIMAGMPQEVRFNNGSTSGNRGRGRFTVATAPEGGGDNPAFWDDRHTIAQGYMSNLNRDQYIAGQQFAGIDSFQHDIDAYEDYEDLSPAETFDLELDDEDFDERPGRSVRRTAY